MSFPKQGSPTTQTKLNTPTRGATLNPNAAEFVPFSLRPSPGTTNIVDVTAKFHASASSSKRVLDRSESSISANSDEEARQYWQQQLPDDITPDFNVVGEDDHHGLGSLSLGGLSLHSGSETNRHSVALDGGYKMTEALDLSAHRTNGGSFSDKLGFPISVYGDDPSSTSYLQRTSKPWEMQLSSDHLFGNDQEGYSFEEIAGRHHPKNLAAEPSIVNNSDLHTVEFLASQFPGFAADSLAEVYFANGCDLNLTIEMLTQLEVCLFLFTLSYCCLMSILDGAKDLEFFGFNYNGYIIMTHYIICASWLCEVADDVYNQGSIGNNLFLIARVRLCTPDPPNPV